MLYTKIQNQSIPRSGDQRLLSALPYMDMAATLFNGAKPLEQKYQHPFDRRPHVKSCKHRSSGFREEDIKMSHFIHVQTLGPKADNPQGREQI